MTKETADGEVMREITTLDSGFSPTAASAFNPLYGPSGAMDYAVILGQQGGPRTSTVVNAATGDEAAELAQRKYPGWKVVYVGPASSEVRATDDDFAGV